MFYNVHESLKRDRESLSFINHHKPFTIFHFSFSVKDLRFTKDLSKDL